MPRKAIKTKRVYDPPTRSDGRRFLVDRLWPRGLKKDAVQIDGWLKEAAPSDKLRHWFGHDPTRWDEFQRRYATELNKNSGALESLLGAARRGTVTLLYSARDTEHNNAVALKHYLEKQLKRSAPRHR